MGKRENLLNPDPEGPAPFWTHWELQARGQNFTSIRGRETVNHVFSWFESAAQFWFWSSCTGDADQQGYISREHVPGVFGA